MTGFQTLDSNPTECPAFQVSAYSVLPTPFSCSAYSLDLYLTTAWDVSKFEYRLREGIQGTVVPGVRICLPDFAKLFQHGWG